MCFILLNFVCAQYNFVCAQYNFVCAQYNFVCAQYNFVCVQYNFVCVQYNLRFYVSNAHPTSQEGPIVLIISLKKHPVVRSTWYMT
jgi:hypothetical protein